MKIKNFRKKVLAPSLSLSYDNPLHLIRGKGQFLYDINGEKYLDAVNNIQHVGHSHPRIAKIAYEQFKKLNTNTRYLDKNVLDYAQSIIDSLPKKLSVCFFTNSGSESNDLALRIARNSAKNRNTIVLDGAYHGHTISLIEISPYKYKGLGGFNPPPYVHEIPTPNLYKGLYKGITSIEKCLETFTKCAKKLSTDGFKPTFIFESFMGCGGQIPLPASFLKNACEIIHDLGGICIADEIQVGFGRIGKHFWGFNYQGVNPDIVTIGKSIGNGHPLSAIITTEELANQFNNGMEYFNSFGGNPVSSAIGHTVLKIIKDEKLQKNALNVGFYLKKELLSLKKTFEIIGDVRGEGLFLGIEIIAKTDIIKPDPKAAKQIVNQMKELGVLLSTDGPYNNVIKIKPPIIFNEKDADFLLNKLDKTISSISKK